MKKTKFIAIITLSVLMATKIYSQGSFSLHLGPAFPVSDFAADGFLYTRLGAAAIGVNIGTQYIYPISDKGFGVFGGVDFNYNGLQKDFKDAVEEFYENSTGVDVEYYKFHKYINIPITAGINYSFRAADKIAIFANLGLALNFLKMTDTEEKHNGQTTITSAGLANNLGFVLGTGVSINEKMSVAIGYFALGKHDLIVETKSATNFPETQVELKVDIVTLTLGYKF